MNSVQNTSRKRPAEKNYVTSNDTGTKRRTKARCLPSIVAAPDRLTTLPQELLTDILKRTNLTPVGNVRLQGVNRRFCQTLRDNTFWRHVSPEMPQPNAPLTYLQQQIVDADMLIRQTKTHPSELLYWQFQARTAQGPLCFTRDQQRLLVHFWTQSAVIPYLIDPQSPYDLARAALPHVTPFYTFRRYGDDANLMQARAERGAAHMQALSPRLRCDAQFMHKIIDTKLENYSLADDALRQDPGFNRPILTKHAIALSLMPETIRGNRELALTALQYWDMKKGVMSGLQQPFLSIAEGLRRDPEILYACTKVCPDSFVLAVKRYPHLQWDQDRKLVALALKSQLSQGLYTSANPYVIFTHVHPDLRDDEEISLLAITRAQANYSLVSQRLRLQFAWCAKALAVNPRVAYMLHPERRNDRELIATMPPPQQMTHLAALQSTIGSDQTMLAELLRHPDVRQGRRFEHALNKVDSVYSRIDLSLKRDPQVLREILDFDGRELGLIPAARQQDAELYNYASQAFFGQLVGQHETQSLRHTKLFSLRRNRPNGHAALGLFARDAQFARRLLLHLPECDYLFAPGVRALPDIISLSRLGMLLQEEARVHTTTGKTTSPISLLSADLRDTPDTFVLNLALGAFHMIRKDWIQAKLPFQRALTHTCTGRAHAASNHRLSALVAELSEPVSAAWRVLVSRRDGTRTLRAQTPARTSRPRRSRSCAAAPRRIA